MAETDDALKADNLRLTKKRLFFMKQADLNPGAVGVGGFPDEWVEGFRPLPSPPSETGNG